jgi:hypothetical protein
MYGYNSYILLDKEEVLKRVSEKDIFKALFNEDIVLNKGKYYTAPYRRDNHADCFFEVYEGVLCFVDFASTGKKSKSCFDVIMQMYNISFSESIAWCNEEFNLGLGNSPTKVKKKLVVENDFIEEETILKSFKKRTITFLPRKFNYKDKHFWGKYEISSNNLIEDKVVPIEIYKAHSKLGKPFSVRPLGVCYAYTDFPEKRVKIYTPYGNKFNKWITDCNQDDVGSINQLREKGDLLVITKSYKDCRVLRNQGIDSIWFQNEGMFPNEKIIKSLGKRFKHIIIWFDNDNGGITNSRIAVQYINSIIPNKAKSIMLPPKLLLENIKDPSDLLCSRGKEELTSFLKLKNIIKT